MIIATLAALAIQLTSNPQLIDIFSLDQIEGASVQQGCDIWLEAEGYTRQQFLHDLRLHAYSCLEFPTADRQNIEDALEQRFQETGHTNFSAIGFMSFAKPKDDTACVQNLAIGTMTKDEPVEPLDRMSAQTAVLIIMTRLEELDACS